MEVVVEFAMVTIMRLYGLSIWLASSFVLSGVAIAISRPNYPGIIALQQGAVTCRSVRTLLSPGCPIERLINAFCV